MYYDTSLEYSGSMKDLSIRLGIIAFVSGFSLMVFELVAARILAPSIGSSTYVWTSVIGVIIAALSLGYYLGGRMSDARNQQLDVVWLLMTAAMLMTMTRLFYTDILGWQVNIGSDPRVQAMVASLILFAPASLVLGMISPYLVKLNITSLKTSGRSVASLSVLNAAGSIIGTFLTGFVLFQYLGANETLILAILLPVVSSWLLVPGRSIRGRIAVTVIIGIFSLMSIQSPRHIVEVDTASARYQIHTAERGGHTVRGLMTGPGGVQSAVTLGKPDELLFWYTKEMARLTTEVQPKSVLLLGGGALTLPQYLSKKLPAAQIDVVEIDPGLKEISEEYFEYKNPSNVQLIFDDARHFLNRNKKKYDVILVDVYGDTAIPFQLSTSEYVERLKQSLSGDGVVIANVIGGDIPECQDVIDRLSAAYMQQFPRAYFTAEQDSNKGSRYNFILSFSHSPREKFGDILPKPQKPAFTDNYAPTEELYFRCERA